MRTILIYGSSKEYVNCEFACINIFMSTEKLMNFLKLFEKLSLLFLLLPYLCVSPIDQSFPLVCSSAFSGRQRTVKNRFFPTLQANISVSRASLISKLLQSLLSGSSASKGVLCPSSRWSRSSTRACCYYGNIDAIESSERGRGRTFSHGLGMRWQYNSS